MAKRTPPARRPWQALEPIPGTVRECLPYAGEIARHRVITADGFDYVVTTLEPQSEGETHPHHVSGLARLPSDGAPAPL